MPGRLLLGSCAAPPEVRSGAWEALSGLGLESSIQISKWLDIAERFELRVLFRLKWA